MLWGDKSKSLLFPEEGKQGTCLGPKPCTDTKQPSVTGRKGAESSLLFTVLIRGWGSEVGRNRVAEKALLPRLRFTEAC